MCADTGTSTPASMRLSEGFDQRFHVRVQVTSDPSVPSPISRRLRQWASAPDRRRGRGGTFRTNGVTIEATNHPISHPEQPTKTTSAQVTTLPPARTSESGTSQVSNLEPFGLAVAREDSAGNLRVRGDDRYAQALGDRLIRISIPGVP